MAQAAQALHGANVVEIAARGAEAESEIAELLLCPVARALGDVLPYPEQRETLRRVLAAAGVADPTAAAAGGGGGGAHLRRRPPPAAAPISGFFGCRAGSNSSVLFSG